MQPSWHRTLCNSIWSGAPPTMVAASRFSPATLKIAAIAIACSGIHTHSRNRPLLRFDSPHSPHTAQWPRDAGLIASGRRLQSEETKKKTPSPTKKKDAAIIDKSNDPVADSTSFEDDDDSAWKAFSRNFDNVREGLSRIKWAGVGDQITDYLLPRWTRLLPDALQKLQFELSMKPGTLADEIWQEAHDPDINPEILLDAQVRVSEELCEEEIAFRKKRKEHVTKALAGYLDLDESDVHPDDVPTIAICGSGGGLRALVAGSSSYLSAHEAGLFDCVTYSAGVSGSCWLQSLYYSSLAHQKHQNIIDHLKTRIGTHIAFPPPALKLVTSAPTNKFLLSGFIEKLKGDPESDFGLVDIYGLLLSARLLVPNGDLDVQDTDMKLSHQRSFIDEGEHPMPIYTAVRHEIPIEVIAAAAAKETKTTKENVKDKAEVKEKAKQQAWFQWFEFSPYETFCEEVGAGIPTYALGRTFKNGRSVLLESGLGLPEIRISLLMGIWGSAFCATLSHYYKEIRPLVSGIAGFGGLDQLLEEKNNDMIKVHPIEPATIPNFVYGMDGKLPPSCPESMLKTDHFQLMDAGMSNNLPIYPLLRPGRDVDIIVAFDASADIEKENWLSVVDGYARQRGIRNTVGWPVGAGWPKASSKSVQAALAASEADAASSELAGSKASEAQEKPHRQSQDSPPVDPKQPLPQAESSLGHCTVWVGTKQESTWADEPPPTKPLSWEDPASSTFHLMEPNAGIAVVYFPLLPNDAVPGVAPDTTDFMSTWNFIYTPEDIDKVVALAKANFAEGEDMTKRTVRAVYERKKKLREEKAAGERPTIKDWHKKLMNGGDHFG